MAQYINCVIYFALKLKYLAIEKYNVQTWYEITSFNST